MRNEPPPSEPGPRPDYVERVNRVIDHVLAHLDEPLPLDALARLAGFSPFHFHRVFRALAGEPLNAFVKRLRLERALAMLSHGPKRPLTEIALECGFGSSSDFSRSFRQRYGVPPSAFDVETFRAERRAEWAAAVTDAEHRHLLDRLPPGENPDGFEARLRDLPARSVAYLRVVGSYEPGVVPRAYERMMAWAEARGLADGQWLGYMWDDPEIVPHERCRYDVGLVLPRADVDPACEIDYEIGGEIGRLELPAMRVAEVEVRGGIDVEMRAIDWLFGTWLPASGYVPTDQPSFEAWVGRPFAHGMEHFEVDAQLPVARP